MRLLNFKHILSFFLLLTLALFIYSPVSAHELTRDPWLLVDGVDPLIYNPIPQTTTTQMVSAEKIFDMDIKTDQEISFAVQTDVIEDELGLKPETVEYEWEFSDREPITGTDFSVSFPETGNYFLTVRINRTDLNQLIFIDSMMLVVGTPDDAPNLLFNGVSVTPDDSTVNRTFRISRTGEMLFAVDKPNEDKFDYEWDLADSDYIKGVQTSKTFTNTKIPAYIILRQTNKDTGLFSENYVILTSDDDPDFKVVRPAANELIPDNFDSASQNPVFIILIVVLIAALIALGVINRKVFFNMAARLKKGGDKAKTEQKPELEPKNTDSPKESPEL